MKILEFQILGKEYRSLRQNSYWMKAGAELMTNTIHLKIKWICFNQVLINRILKIYHYVRKTCWKENFDCDEKHKWKDLKWQIQHLPTFYLLTRLLLKDISGIIISFYLLSYDVFSFLNVFSTISS